MSDFVCENCCRVTPVCRWCPHRFRGESVLQKCEDWENHPQGFVPNHIFPERATPCNKPKCQEYEERHIREQNREQGIRVPRPKYSKEGQFNLDETERQRQELKQEKATQKAAKQRAKDEAARASAEKKKAAKEAAGREKAAKEAAARAKAAAKQASGNGRASGNGNASSSLRKRDMLRKLVK